MMKALDDLNEYAGKLQHASNSELRTLSEAIRQLMR